MMEELIEEAYYLLQTIFRIGTNLLLLINNWLLIYYLNKLYYKYIISFYYLYLFYRLTTDNTL